jgi:hypothetical protein
MRGDKERKEHDKNEKERRNDMKRRIRRTKYEGDVVSALPELSLKLLSQADIGKSGSKAPPTPARNTVTMSGQSRC